MSLQEVFESLKGGKGSGNFGHGGIKGKRGGSTPGGGKGGLGISNISGENNRPAPPPKGKSFGKPAVHAATKKLADSLASKLNGSETIKTGNGGTKFRTNSTIADIDGAAGENGFKYEGFGKWKNSKGYEMERSAPIGKSKGDTHTIDITIWPPLED